VADVIPPALITARFFPDLQDKIDTATTRAEELGREIEELSEEHGAEGGLLELALTDAGKLTAASVKARDKSDEADAEERPLLKQAAKLIAAEAAAKKAAKEAEARLTEAVLKKYPELTEDEIRALVVQDKWLADIAAAIGAEVEARTEGLTARVRVLTERYGQTLPQIMENLEALEARVAGHLAAMGVAHE
jgi:type I restriction enzyme M protein